MFNPFAYKTTTKTEEQEASTGRERQRVRENVQNAQFSFIHEENAIFCHHEIVKYIDP